MRIFSAEKWLKDAMGLNSSAKDIISNMKSWVLKLDGINVDELRAQGYVILKDWIIET